MRSMCGADAGCLAINYQSLYEEKPTMEKTTRRASAEHGEETPFPFSASFSADARAACITAASPRTTCVQGVGMVKGRVGGVEIVEGGVWGVWMVKGRA